MMGSFAIKTVGIVLALALVAACSEKDPQLLNLRKTGSGPDEFAILPAKPLQAPESYSNLPVPTPGVANRTDPTPKADAVAALGGNAAALNPGRGVQDSALIAHTTRYGIAESIRRDLAATDLEYRRNNDGRLLERLFNVNVYFKAYRPYELDQYRELERFRRAGVRTPAVPPDPSN